MKPEPTLQIPHVAPSYVVCRLGGAPPETAQNELGLTPKAVARLERLFQRRPGGGADAMSVGFQSSGLTQNGFWGATDSLQITLDSYQNAGDPYASTLRVTTSGGGVIGTLDLAGALESTYYFNMSASYNANTHLLDVTFKNDLADAVNGSWTVNLSNEFSTDAYYGFSGWTGAASEKHDVLSTTLNAVPEPSTFALLVAGVGGVLLRRRARA